MENVRIWNYELYDENGQWLGQVVITSDGFFGSVTDYGNFSFAWRAYGEDFKKFLLGLTPDYFGSKMFQGMAYIVSTKAVEKSCRFYATKILPALQVSLQKEDS